MDSGTCVLRRRSSGRCGGSWPAQAHASRGPPLPTTQTQTHTQTRQDQAMHTPIEGARRTRVDPVFGCSPHDTGAGATDVWLRAWPRPQETWASKG